MSQQGLRQASFRAIGGTTSTYNSDAFAAFKVEATIPDNATFNEAFILWLQNRLGSSATNINDLLAEWAAAEGATNASSIGSFGPDLLDETETLLAAMTAQPTVARQLLINTLIGDLKDAGVWDKLDALYVFAAHDAQAARLNWIDPGTFDITLTDAPTFLADTHYATDGTNDALNTNFNPTTASDPKFTRDSAVAGLWNLNNGQGFGHFGNYDGTDGVTIVPRSASDTTIIRINQSASDAVANNTSIGYFAGNRSASNAHQTYKNGVSTDTGTTASTAPNNITLKFGSIQAANFSQGQFAAGFIGQSLTAAEHADLYDALEDYLVEVGAWDALDDLLLQTAQTLPDGAQNSDAGKGWTCTGIVYDRLLNDGAGGWWIGNAGRNNEETTPAVPSVCAVSLDGATLLDEIDIATLYSTEAPVQGVALDTSDETLWIACTQDNAIYHLTKDGVDLDDTISVTAPNGLAYDSQRDDLWYLRSSDDTLIRITKAGSVQQTIALSDLDDTDQLFYDSERDWIWYTAGANGENGHAISIDCDTEVEMEHFRLLGTQSAEGISLRGDVLYIANDAYFHQTGTLLNQLQTYEVHL